jgi:surfeit locus 1 family protein
MMAARWRMEPYDLNATPLPAELDTLTYRRIQASGTFDYDHQVALKNQFYLNAPGVVLVTPLVMDDGRAVLVARGWVPEDQAARAAWPQLEEGAAGTVLGTIAKSQPPRDATADLNATGPQDAWFRVDIPALQTQMPYPLEPGWIVQLPEEGRTSAQLPVREEPIALDEGNHLGYAVQWFTFALILGFGYIMLVRQQERRRQRPSEPSTETAAAGTPETATPEPLPVVATGEVDPAVQANQPLQQADRASEVAAPAPAGRAA